jgi:5-methylcytosine-specific restriction protein A
MSDDVKIGKTVFDRWSSGVSKRLQKGDRFFLIQLGEEPKGIFASGKIVKASFED